VARKRIKKWRRGLVTTPEQGETAPAPRSVIFSINRQLMVLSSSV
jgi:hypothetical protein